MNKVIKIYLIFILFLSSLNISAQNYMISVYNGQTVSTCTGTFFDAGGGFSGYTFWEDYTVTFCSDDLINTHIKLYFNQFNINPNDTLYIYDGPNTASPLMGAFNNNNSLFLQPIEASVQNLSGCLTVRFKADGNLNAPGWEADISCVPICQEVIARIDSLLCNPFPNDSGYIDICAGTPIDFAGRGYYPENLFSYLQSDATSLLIWDFGDGTVDTGASISHVYDSVMGYDVNLTVIDTHGCVNTNSIGIRVRISDNPVNTMISTPEICVFDSLKVSYGDDKGSMVRIEPVSHYQSASLRYDSTTFIPDGGATGGQCYYTNVVYNVFDASQTITSVSDIISVTLNAEHSWVGDLKVTLICPNGQSAILKDYIQMGGADLGIANTNDCLLPFCVNLANMNPPGDGWSYAWAENAPKTFLNDYATQAKIDSGTYEPEQSLSTLIGCPLNGTWSIEVCDYWAYDNGYVFWWELALDPNLIPQGWGYTVPFDSVVWNGPFIVDQTDSSFTIHPDVSGTHPYQLTVHDAYGCSYDTVFNIKVNPLPQVNIGSDTTLCPYDSMPIIDAGNHGAGASYLWMKNNNFAGSKQELQTSSHGEYVVRVTDPKGCSGFDTLNIAMEPAPIINLSTQNAHCSHPDGSASMLLTGGTGPYNIQWNTVPPQAGNTAMGLVPGTYTYIVSNALCDFTDQFKIYNIPAPAVDFVDVTEENCGQKNGMALAQVSGGSPPYTMEWITDPPQSGPLAMGLSTGYTIFMVSDSFCIGKDSVFIPYIPGAEAWFSVYPGVAEMPDPIFRFRDESSGTPVEWNWDFGDNLGTSKVRNPSYKYNEADSFTVWLTITDEDGCKDSTFKKLMVRDFQTLYLPNSFTPNGDGLNDGFGPIGENMEIERYEMHVFNRWGKLVYQGHDISDRWNGRMNNVGEMLPRGTYVYKILIKTHYKPLKEYRGTVTLF